MNNDMKQLFEAFCSDVYDVRIQALNQLMMFRDDDAVDVFIEALGDLHPRVRVIAGLMLGQIRDLRAVPSLIACLTDTAVDSFSSVGATAALALGAIGDPQAVEPLITALDHEHTQRQALEALGKLNDPRSVERLIQLVPLLYSPSLSTILGNLGDRRAVEPLIHTLRTPPHGDSPHPPWYQTYRYYTVRALGKLGDPRALPLLEELRDTEHTPVLKGKSIGDMASGRAHP